MQQYGLDMQGEENSNLQMVSAHVYEYDQLYVT